LEQHEKERKKQPLKLKFMFPTDNLDKFGEAELKKAIKILTAISSANFIHPYWEYFSALRLYYNELNGFVFVVDSIGNTIAINEFNNNQVEGWFCNPDTGTEGFLNTLKKELSEMLPDDYEYFKKIIDDAYNLYGKLVDNTP